MKAKTDLSSDPAKASRHRRTPRLYALKMMAAIPLLFLLQISVVAAQSEPGIPTVTCGAGNFRVEATNGGNDADYATLQVTFMAINAGTHTGVINIGVCGDSLAEPAAGATLNASGTGSAFYSSVLMTPIGARTISGAISGGLALITLNGADNVTIDGLNSDENSLTLTNTTASSVANTSTILFTSGAQNNVITNCSVLGSSNATVGVPGGAIVLGTSSTGGNNGNLISNNNIGPAGATLPTQGIVGLGSASPNDNTDNVIDDNNIFDFFSPTVGASGISILANNNAWTISNNRLYQTAARTFISAGMTYAGITVISNSNSFNIVDNRIGFDSANGTGATNITGSTNLFVGLNLVSTSNTTPTSLQGNVISGIRQSTASSGFDNYAAFRGIYVDYGRYDIGTVTGNTVGSLDGSSTITVTESSTGAVYGIYDDSENPDTISNNQIGAITINGTGTGRWGFLAIYLIGTSYGRTTVSNNQIGASGAGAITDYLVGPYSMYGIYQAIENIFVSGNTIQNMSGNSNATSAVVNCGILLPYTSDAPETIISQNLVHSLSNNSGTAPNSVHGVDCSFPPNANVVERNVVHSLSITSSATTCELGGLVVKGTATVKNNMVRLGIDDSGSPMTAGCKIYGIYGGGAGNLCFNSVYIGGFTSIASAQDTFAFLNEGFNSTRTYWDNIFFNERSNVSGTGKHYAIGILGVTGVTSNRNDLYAPGIGGFVGRSPGYVDQLTLANWQAATNQDLNTISADPQFVDPNGPIRPSLGLLAIKTLDDVVNLHIQGSSPCVGAGASAGNVINDIDNDVRNPFAPDIGADEISSYTDAGITITKTADAAVATVGCGQIGFIVKVMNAYSGTANNLSISDPLPAGSGVDWSIDSINTDSGWSVSGYPPNQNLVYSPTVLAGNTTTKVHIVSSTANSCGILNNIASFTSSNGGSGNAAASIVIACPISCSSGTLVENFDGVIAPALPASWSATNAIGSAPSWVTSNSGNPPPVADSSPNAAYVDGPPTVSDKRLDSPPYLIANGGSQLSFRSNFVLIAAAHGGVLEIAIGCGAPFMDIITAGGIFISGGYNGTMSTANGNPLAGRPAWTEVSHGFITTTVLLPPAASGNTVVFRWRLGSGDTQSTAGGWRVDNVHLLCNSGPTPTPTSSASPATPTPTPTAIPTPTPSPTSTPAFLSISGTIYYCSSLAPTLVPDVVLTLTGDTNASTSSDGSGNYTLTSLTSGGSYTVTPGKAARLPGSAGIDTVDVVATQRHLLVIGTPLSGCRLTAADVNGDSAVTTVDVVAIQRFLLGLTTGIANVGKYRFNPVNRSYPELVSDQTDQNYDTLVFGDVASPFAE